MGRANMKSHEVNLVNAIDLTFCLYILMLRIMNKKNARKALIVSGMATPNERTIAQPTQLMRLTIPTNKVKMPKGLVDKFNVK